LSIAEQLSGLLTRRNTESEITTLTESDILIRPKLGDISAGDFDRVNEAIPIGRAAALENLDRLQMLATPSSSSANSLVAKTAPGTRQPIIDFIRWNNQSKLSDEFIVSRVDEFELGQPLDTEKLESGIARIYGTEAFQKVSFRLVEDRGRTGVEVTAVERSWGPKYLQFGLNIAAQGEGENLTNASVSHLSTALNPSGGEWRNTLTLGNETSFSSAFHQPFGRNYRYFVAPKLEIGSTDFTVYESGNAIGIISVFSARSELAIGREFGNWGGLQVGARYVTGERDVRVGEPIPQENFQLGEVFFDLALDRLDNRNFPRHGTFGAVRWIGARESLGSEIGRAHV
jgi:NTE family protein